MPIADRGYKRWDGELQRGFFHWLPITYAGIRLQKNNNWLRRFILIAWTPFLFFSLLFLALGWATSSEALQEGANIGTIFLQALLSRDIVLDMVQRPEAIRPLAWSLLIYQFLHYTQLASVVVVAALAGPRLISDDLKTNALALYFSRPLLPRDYILGKLGVLVFFISLVTVVPVIGLYGLGILFSPGAEVVLATLPVLVRAVAAAGLVLLCASLAMLALSSLSENSRTLAMMWFAIFVLGELVAFILTEGVQLEWARRLSILDNMRDATWVVMNVSQLAEPYLQGATGFKEMMIAFEPPIAPESAFWVLGGVVMVSLLILRKRIRRHGIGAA